MADSDADRAKSPRRSKLHLGEGGDDEGEMACASTIMTMDISK